MPDGWHFSMWLMHGERLVCCTKTVSWIRQKLIVIAALVLQCGCHDRGRGHGQLEEAGAQLLTYRLPSFSTVFFPTTMEIQSSSRSPAKFDFRVGLESWKQLIWHMLSKKKKLIWHQPAINDNDNFLIDFFFYHEFDGSHACNLCKYSLISMPTRKKARMDWHAII